MKSWLHFDPNEKLTRADALSLTAAACAVFSGTAHLGLAWRHYQDSPVAGLLFGLMGIWQLYAAYGGVFIAAATLWGWWVDGRAPDRWDWLGVALILWMPRR